MGLRRFRVTPSAPAIPYVTRIEAGADEVARMRDALLRMFAEPDLATARQDLLLDGIEVTEIEDYRRIVELRDQAAALGYPELA